MERWPDLDAKRDAPTSGEFVLPYATVKSASDPEATLVRFLPSTYARAADLGAWDRDALEREPVAP